MYNATLNLHIIRFLTRHVYIGAKIVIVWFFYQPKPLLSGYESREPISDR